VITSLFLRADGCPVTVERTLNLAGYIVAGLSFPFTGITCTLENPHFNRKRISANCNADLPFQLTEGLIRVPEGVRYLLI
jgi:hypothetical protein